MKRVRMRIWILIFIWRGSGFGFSPWCGSRSELRNKGSNPWQSVKICSYSIHFGLPSANLCGSGSGSESSLSLWCGSGFLFDADADTDVSKRYYLDHGERKRPAHSLPVPYLRRLLKFIPGCVLRHWFQFNTPPPLWTVLWIPIHWIRIRIQDLKSR